MNTSILLMKALGWQGGTVHQVAFETGLSVIDILNLPEHYDNESNYNYGVEWAKNGNYKNIPESAKNNKDFWIGVISYYTN